MVVVVIIFIIFLLLLFLFFFPIITTTTPPPPPRPSSSFFLLFFYHTTILNALRQASFPTQSMQLGKSSRAQWCEIEVMSGTQFKRKKQHKKPLALSYFGIGMVGETRDAHHGTLLRSSYQYGTSFIARWSGKHTKHTMRDTDTTKAWCYIPVFSYPSVEKLTKCAPYSCPWVACVDAPGGTPLKDFKHPSLLYLFPGDDKGAIEEYANKMQVSRYATPISALFRNGFDDVTNIWYHGIV